MVKERVRDKEVKDPIPWEWLDVYVRAWVHAWGRSGLGGCVEGFVRMCALGHGMSKQDGILPPSTLIGGNPLNKLRSWL